MPSRSKKKEVFCEEAVRHHLMTRHPNCPEPITEEIVLRIHGRTWSPPVTIGQAVGIAATTFVRHRLTDYERLLKVDRLKREVARSIVAPRVAEIIGSWK